MEKEYLASLHSRRAPLRPGHPRLQLLLLQRREVLLGHVEDNVLKYIRCKETMGLGWVSLAIRLSPKVKESKRKGENAQVGNKTIEESVAILVGLGI